MLETLRQCWALTSTKARSRWWFLLAANVAFAFVEVVAALGLVILLGLLTGTALDALPGGRRLMEFAGTSDPDRTLRFVCAFLFCVFAVKSALAFLVMKLQNRLPLRAGNELADRLFRLYLGAPYSFHLERNTAETIRNLNASVDVVYRIAGGAALTILSEGIVASALLIVTGWASPAESLLVVALGILVMAAIYRRYQARVALWGGEVQSLSKEGLIRARDALEGIKEVRVGGFERYFSVRYAETRKALSERLVRQSDLQQTPRLAMEAGFIAIIITLVALLSLRGNRQDVMPLIGLYAYVGFRLLPTVSRIWAAMNSIRFAGAATRLVYDDVQRLTAAAEARHGDAARTPFRFETAIEMRDVRFRYPGGQRDALAGVDVRLARGSLVAIVGASGSGKSTLVDVLLGLQPPQSGRVLVDGRDIASDRRAWQDNIGYVPQAVFVLDDTLRRNIAFGLPDAEIDEEEVRKALDGAQLTDVVAALPEGLDTRLGERGSRLSGGQRQRVGIARALYAGRRLLVLDEAMSALDTLTERELNETLRQLRGRHTIVLITHRLGALAECDLVLMMAEGKLVASGSFDDLYRSAPSFKLLFDAAH